MAEDEGFEGGRVGGEAVSAALAVILGSQVGDPTLGAMAAGVAAPVLNEAVQGAVRELATRRQRQMAVAIEMATESSGISPDELVRELLADPTRSEIFRLGLIAASNTGYEAKARAIGRALATGALERDRAKLDLEVLFLRAVQDIDPPHVAVLASFTKSGREVGLGVDDNATGQWNSVQLGMIFEDRYEEAMPALLAVLQSHGLIERPGGGGGALLGGGGSKVTDWAITPLGVATLERLHELGRAT